ncbi:unnamed protein product [Caenorhabditis brenneri]
MLVLFFQNLLARPEGNQAPAGDQNPEMLDETCFERLIRMVNEAIRMTVSIHINSELEDGTFFALTADIPSVETKEYVICVPRGGRRLGLWRRGSILLNLKLSITPEK